MVVEVEVLVVVEVFGDVFLGIDFGFFDFFVDGGFEEYEF